MIKGKNTYVVTVFIYLFYSVYISCRKETDKNKKIEVFHKKKKKNLKVRKEKIQLLMKKIRVI